jgi:2-dehydro-3-deoxyphosphogluconate aldolase / (4S)-4-hydroxy-2-oxoglutarate aldolase
MPDPVISVLEKYAVVPAIVLEDPNQAAPLAQALISGGLPIAEVTLRTPDALDALRRMAAFPELLTGAGTVLNLAQAQSAVGAGAKFIVSPGMDAEMIRWCLEKEITIIPGASTPTEIMLAMNLGLRCVKFFPCEASGGLGMLQALRGPFPEMRYLATGGIKMQTISDYLAFPPVLAVGGTWMVREEWLANARFDVIEDGCRTTMEVVKDARWQVTAAARVRSQ